MNLYKFEWTNNATGRKMIGEVYGSSRDTALEGLGLNSMEWHGARLISKVPYFMPSEGDVNIVMDAADYQEEPYPDEEEQ